MSVYVRALKEKPLELSTQNSSYMHRRSNQKISYTVSETVLDARLLVMCGFPCCGSVLLLLADWDCTSYMKKTGSTHCGELRTGEGEGEVWYVRLSRNGCWSVRRTVHACCCSAASTRTSATSPTRRPVSWRRSVGSTTLPPSSTSSPDETSVSH